MAKKLHKTNALRILDAQGVSYRSVTYVVDESDVSGVHVAETLGQSPDMVFKTLVLVGERTGNLVCCIPSSSELDLKKVARAAGDKKVEMLHMRDLFDTTGYIRGGCSPVGMKKSFPTFIDETAQLFDVIALSGGQRGLQMLLAPDDLVSVTRAAYADLCM